MVPLLKYVMELNTCKQESVIGLLEVLRENTA
jgi:hypothetical protein